MTTPYIRMAYLLHYGLECVSGHCWHGVIEGASGFVVNPISKRIDITRLNGHDYHVGSPWWRSSRDYSSCKSGAQATADGERDVSEASK